MSFDEFWEIYPKKVGIGNARGQWIWAIGKASEDTILEGARRYREYVAENETEFQYQLAPAKWLAGEHWADALGSRHSRRDPDLELKAQARAIEAGGAFGRALRERLPRQRVEEMIKKGYLQR